MCGRIMVGYSRIMFGSVPHCKWGFTCVLCMCGRQNSIVIYNYKSFPHCKWGFTCVSCMCGRQNSIVICNCRSFPQCKWDCKWYWWMSCRWSFEGSLARNVFLRDSKCTKPYVFPFKVRPRTSMIYLCGATGARRSRVWSDHGRIMGGSWADHGRIGSAL